MSTFKVRIELLGDADQDDYIKLRKRMIASGFDTVVEAEDGSSWHLPPDDYRYVLTRASADVVRNKASEVVSSGLRTGLSDRILVVEVASWAAQNLEPL